MRPKSITTNTSMRLSCAVCLGLILVLSYSALAEDSPLIEAKQIFKALPKDMGVPAFPTAPELVRLGRMLFFDPRLSADGTVSCARCHQPSLYGTDALPKSIGVENRMSPRNAPTILNAALQFSEHWLGDRSSVEDQASKSLLGHASFGNLEFANVASKIKEIPGYENMFAEAFPDQKQPITQENCGRAIGAYERTLVSPSPFDSYLSGQSDTMSIESKAGLGMFISCGCASCHNGVGVGGSMFQKFGVHGDYWNETGSGEIDKGRYQITNNSTDSYVFKVPSLRNVAMTPPYFHDGSVQDLDNAVRIMARLQLGKELTSHQVRLILRFLESLTGTLPDNFSVAVTLPTSGFQVK